MKTKLVRPVLVESKDVKPNLLLLKNDNTLVHFDEMFYNIWKAHKEFGDFTPTNATYQQLILISLEDEKIEVGDWFMDSENLIHQCGEIKRKIGLIRWDGGSEVLESCKKVIATQSQLSPEYIQQFIEEYNKGEMKDVEIETIGKIGESKIDYVPITDNGYITIVTKEAPIYTEEEMYRTLHNLMTDIKLKGVIINDDTDLKEWFNQHKK